MASISYVEVPACATPLQEQQGPRADKPKPKVITSLPQPTQETFHGNSSGIPTTPTKPVFRDLPTMLLSSALQVPSNPVANPRGAASLMSTKDPLSIPIMTVNFKRFTSKIGPVYWMLDRIEEIVTWKKSWTDTAVWMAAYGFLCYFPRLILLLPHFIVVGIMLYSHKDQQSAVSHGAPIQVGEGSVDWQANLQATQNIIGAYSDVHDAIIPYVPYLNFGSPYSNIIFSFTLISLALLIPVVHVIPMRLACLIIGWAPLFLAHPFTQSTLIPLFRDGIMRPFHKMLTLTVRRLIDDDNLEDKHWGSEIKQVELWENERWSPNNKDTSTSPGGTWNKNNLKPRERQAWTRGRDGFSGISEGGHVDVGNLTFSLDSGWSFVETEDWRPDLEATWISNVGADDNGWVYTNDSWMSPRAAPAEEWFSNGMTRRRRWTRRIYFAGSA